MVLCTAATIKSLQLKLLEKMDVLRDAKRKQHPTMERDVRAITRVLSLFRSGCLIMDEVDLLLHPLRSELNFPIGERLPLDFSPERWTCAIHALDAVFYLERGAMSVAFHQSGRAHRTLDELKAVIEDGYAKRALQRSPHLVLLNLEWYHEQMRPVMAKWMMLWLEANHVGGLTPRQVELYIMGGADAHAAKLAADGARDEIHDDDVIDDGADDAELQQLLAMMEHSVDTKCFKLLNLAKEWLRTYLPFTLQKIDRVSFGLLSVSEYQRLLKSEPHMPRSRFKLAIPFVGKDVPSRASEFAHPDIIIGLTILAYRYEGLRRPDFEQDVIAPLRADFEKEVGPFPLRKSCQLYHSWVTAAGGIIKGSGGANGGATAGVTDEDEERTVVPLWLLKQSNDEQMTRLYKLLRTLPSTIHWLLENVTFPSYMQHQTLKLSASGQELGGSMLFGRRIGFSGTPSDLLPLDLGKCGYEKGSEGKMLHVLTDPSVMSTQALEGGWTVTSLLRHVATATPSHSALIDTGALITGLSNRQVAQQLLDLGLSRWCEGVVFLDENDEKMILVKATGRVLKLSQCGVSVDKRFAFYDQIHTTGMDIKHCLSARAAVTLGKDMVFRDLAQGAFRMRGIGAGQTVALLIIPEVQQLMQRQLAKAGYSRPALAYGGGDDGANLQQQQQTLLDVTAWLVLNSMRTERLQFDQLCHQNLANIWRANAFEQLHEGHRRFAVKPSAASGYTLDMLGEAFVSNRDGNVSRARIEGRVLALYFRDRKAEGCSALDAAMRNIYDGYSTGSGSAFEVIQIDVARTPDEFVRAFREMPWLAIPCTHARRQAALRKLFEVDSDEQSLSVVLLNQEGQTITRHGRRLIELAHTCQRAVDKKAKTTKELGTMRKELDKEKAKLRDEMTALEPTLAKAHSAKAKMAALRPAELREIRDYMAEPVVDEAAQHALDATEQRLCDARRLLIALTPAQLDDVRLTDRPSAMLKQAVEAVCVMLELRADFSLAQSRLMRATDSLRRRLLHYGPELVPRNAPARLRGYLDAPTPDGTAEPVAAALHAWVGATLTHEAASTETKISMEEVQCSPGMAAACEAVCDLYGLSGVDDDPRGALMLAAAFADGSAGGEGDGGETGEVASADAPAAELDALHQKVYRLKQFLSLLAKEVDTTRAMTQTLHDSVGSDMERLLDRHAWMQLLAAPSKDEVIDLALTMLLELIAPDTLTNVADGTTPNVRSIAATTINPSNRGTFDKFGSTLRNVAGEMAEGRVSVRDFGAMQSYGAQLDERYRTTKFEHGGNMPSYLCKWLVECVKYHGGIVDLTSKSAQLAEMKKELAVAQSALEAATPASGGGGGVYDGVSATQVKAVQEDASKRGAPAPAAWARWALKRTAGDEALATALIVAQPKARLVLAALRDPSSFLLATAEELQPISTQTARKVKMNLRKEGVRKLVEVCVEATERFGSDDAQIEKAEAAAKLATTPAAVDEGGERAEEAADALGVHASIAELLLLRWVVGVCEFVEARARTQPQQQKLMLLERKVDDMNSRLSASLTSQRNDAASAARKLEVPLALFPVEKPWSHFPWEAHFLPRSDAEESMRAAIGLRDLPLLTERIVKAGSVGLTHRNSRVCFEAKELRDMLLAQRAMADAAAAAAAETAAAAAHRIPPSAHVSDSQNVAPLTVRIQALEDASAAGPPPIARKDSAKSAMEDEDNYESAVENADDEPRSPLRGQSASRANAPPVPPKIVREKTSDAMNRLGKALDVFVEPISTEVPAGLPQPKPFVEVLRARAAQFDEYVINGDAAVRDAILATVSSAVGVTDIETEQCREQEQEKAQEQEQEQEIEMERYVDMAYQRDDEEPRRWAFCTLGETAAHAPIHDEADAQRHFASAPFAAGTFYPASQFKLHGRAPLPFASCLSVSRNHFNLDWVGERRLKNAVMVLEWVPSVGSLARVPPRVAPLTPEQGARLQAALELLDLHGDGMYDRVALARVLQAAEHTQPDDATLDELLAAKGNDGRLSRDAVRELLVSGALREGDLGRHFVLLSLAEAETIRCILHQRQGKALIPNTDVALALRCIPAHDAVFDASATFPVATAYEQRVSHQSFRFMDSAMHYKPADLNVLLRNLPAPAASRRLYFQMVVACRRRLAKRWEQTPLAKLFEVDDEWAMLHLEAIRMRMRAAIEARQLLLHDAFLLFDHDDDGALSLIEVRSALLWLGVPQVSDDDVLAFVRSISRKAHVTYANFFELLAPPDCGPQVECLADTTNATSKAITTKAITTYAATPPVPDTAHAADAIAVLCNDAACVATLEQKWHDGVSAERSLDEQLEGAMATHAERSKKLIEQQLLDSNFEWMGATRSAGARNPHTTRTSCFYDFTRGAIGTQKGLPLWMDGRGRWFAARQGTAAVPCLKGVDSFLVLRVPFRKSGGGTYCNTWTLSMMVRFPTLSARPLLATGGWDQFSAMHDSDDPAQLTLSDSGALGTLNTYTSADAGASAARVRANTWHALSMSVDAVGGIVRTYIDGEETAVVRNPKICKDGQHALKGRLALFFARGTPPRYYLRSATVHNRALDLPQIRSEHGKMHQLLMMDAVEMVPPSLHPTITAEHAETKTSFDTPSALKARVRELRASGHAASSELWRALLLEIATPSDARPSTQHVDALLSRLNQHDLPVGVHHTYEARTNSPIEESDAPMGETLLHAAAHAGRDQLVGLLLTAGAKPLAGCVSGCTPLHAAASAGHADVCATLLKAGVSVSALSSATKRTALHMACRAGHADTAKLLVATGGADPYLSAGLGGESAMALLRRQGTPASLELLASLDEICGASAKTSTDDKDPAADAADMADAAKAAGVETTNTMACERSYDSDESDIDDEGGGGSEEDDDLFDEDEDGEEE